MVNTKATLNHSVIIGLLQLLPSPAGTKERQIFGQAFDDVKYEVTHYD